MRGATDVNVLFQNEAGISIHTPHAGSDRFSVMYMSKIIGFQSTLPMRGAT